MRGANELWAAKDWILRPSAAFSRVSANSSAFSGLGPVLGTAVAFAAFLALLAARGHEPSGPLVLPIPRASYYAWEAALVIPLHAVMFVALSGSAHGLSRLLGGRGSHRATRAIAGWSMGLAWGVGWLVPDLLVYATRGFEALGTAIRVIAPLSTLWGIVLVTLGIRVVHGLSVGRALLVGCMSWLAHAAIAAPVLR